MRVIPDLRDTPEITLEHCSVLLERIAKAVDLLDGQEGIGEAFIQDIDSELLHEHYVDYFEPEAFQRMFVTELGKGVLVGSYVQRLLEKMKENRDAVKEG